MTRTTMSEAVLLWFRLDLRLADNPALLAAVQRNGPVIPIFVWSPDDEGSWPPGAASRWWLHHSLTRLDQSLRAAGLRLILRRGPALAAIRALLDETKAAGVFWNRRYEPAAVRRDREIEAALRLEGRVAEIFNSALLFEPWTVQTKQGKPFQVFTPFWKACLARANVAKPVAAPDAIHGPRRWPKSLRLRELALEPTIDWAAGLRASWQPGEAGASAELTRFMKERLDHYESRRDQPDVAGTSRLSPHLHFGEIGPRQVWAAVNGCAETSSRARDAFLREIGWREFAHHLLFHFPDTPDQPLRANFGRFPWKRNARALRAWQRGLTGYPIVDAGMRELWHTGFMHNRVRMIAASFLVKDLLIRWQDGAAWFWDTLVDADLANNTLGWQWTAGCGADAAPFFRVFNPVTQGEKFDPAGGYVRRWLPELRAMPEAWIHQPWTAPREVLKAAGVVLGRNYPRPIVDHREARKRALESFRETSS